MPDYRARSGQPKGPFARLVVRPPNAPDNIFDAQKIFTCFGVLDTGSTITFIPLEILEDLGISPLGESAEVLVVGGGAIFTPYIVSMEMSGKPFTNISVYGWEREFALIGRDILDAFHICFNGPISQFDFVGIS